MRVLMVTPYPPKPDGIGAHTEWLVGALSAIDDLDVDVLTFRRPAPHEAQPRVHRLLSADPRSVRSSLELMRRVQPDVVHYQFAIPAFGLAGVGAIAAGLRLRRSRGTRLVFTFHEVRREIDLLRGAGRAMYRKLVGVADGVVVHTEEARELVVRECGADPQSVWLTPLGAAPPAAELVEPPVIERVRRRYELATRPLALCFGYLHPDKGIEHLVEAMARLRSGAADGEIPVDVLIAGSVRPRSGMFRFFERRDHAYESELRRAVDRHGLSDHVRFVGFVPDDDVAALITAARVVVMPCSTVTQSSVLGTAAAAGTPAIASDLPGLRETLGDGGILVPPGDPDALAGALRAIAVDDRLAADLRDRQRRRGDAISLSNVARQLEQVYRNVAPAGAGSCRLEVAIDGS